MQDARRHQLIRVHGAQQRHNGEDPDHGVALPAKDFVRRGCGNERLARHPVEGKHVKEADVHQQINDRDRSDSAEHRSRNVARRISQLAREVDDAVVAIIREDHRLHRQHERSEKREPDGRSASASRKAQSPAENEARTDQNREGDCF